MLSAAKTSNEAAAVEEAPKQVYQRYVLHIKSWSTLQTFFLIIACRYYHLFAQGELDKLIVDTGMADISRSGYDRDNHYVIAIKK